MQLSKEEYASFVMPNCYPSDGVFNQHLTTIKDFRGKEISSYMGRGCKMTCVHDVRMPFLRNGTTFEVIFRHFFSMSAS